MADKKDKRHPSELPFGKQMTSLLIVKDMRSKPKEVLKGVAFIGFICFFLFAFLSRGCQQEVQQQEENRISQHAVPAGTCGA